MNSVYNFLTLLYREIMVRAQINNLLGIYTHTCDNYLILKKEKEKTKWIQ